MQLNAVRYCLDSIGAENDGSFGLLCVAAFREESENGKLNEASDVMEGSLEQDTIACIHDDLMLLIQRCMEEKNSGLGVQLLKHIARSEVEKDPLLRKQLIIMFNSLDDLLEAIKDVSQLCKENVFSWDVIICSSLKLGQSEKVLELYHTMKELAVEPNYNILVAVLKACGNLGSKDMAMTAHMHAVQLGYDSDVFVNAAIIDTYCKFGLFNDARIIFNSMWEQQDVSWNALIIGYCHKGCLQDSLHSLQNMQKEGFCPARSIFWTLLSSCTNSTALELGKQLHANIIGSGFENDMRIYNGLINFYGKCDAIDDACVTFNRGQMQDVVTWNVLLTAHSQKGYFEEVFAIFQAMQNDDCQPDGITFGSLLTAYCNAEDLEKGKQLHSYILALGVGTHSFVGNNLLNMYIKCGTLQDAQTIFDSLPEQDVSSWNMMIKAYLEHELIEKALAALDGMQMCGIQPDHITFLPFVKVCSNILALEHGQHIHASIVKRGFDTQLAIINSLINMYGKCGKLEEAHLLFDKAPEKDILTWNALMTGYVSEGQGLAALRLYLQLEHAGIKPDKGTYFRAIRACTAVSALGLGKRIHEAVKEAGFSTEMSIINALVDMYAKCGSLKDAHRVFQESSNKDVVTWSSLISGYAEQSDYDTAVELFQEMQEEGVKPDGIAFLSLLAACAHKGLVIKGLFWLRQMRDHYEITEELQHYDCIVDLLGCRGLFDEAEDLLETIPFQYNVVGWLSLLGSCKTYTNLKVAKRCFDIINGVDTDHTTSYVLLSSVYTKAGMYREAEELEISRRDKELWKKTGQAYIEVDNHIHCFSADDETHPQTAGIHSKLELLNLQAKQQGLLNDGVYLDTIPPVVQQDLFCRHSEKLATVFGLMTVPRDAPIRVAKNLRICTDCHQAIKIISKIEHRDILVKDIDCIHIFSNGSCSCGDRHYQSNSCTNAH
ncbi:hypothetical protein KP509_20G051200 [Ceratopteris richardii]|uniref:DYW domain-containing protein n=1 Tax=Ceratopteris richardii TaxID=49495 RepID=A0A8T2SFZ3_CERRI|nr:hypothetical protein KP509_20G051200 [Ceratopteris richardii]KAH7331799.1 hypothetical protein KP509_20G051200 [Ceratopteris richardii]KAH7331802.1 hypothetical protein KP509_20G051200 [Ceratopteris richardii]KAH7331803.1 hypothetical protein KP509_20G051200 [Ceratopteris richardii]